MGVGNFKDLKPLTSFHMFLAHLQEYESLVDGEQNASYMVVNLLILVTKLNIGSSSPMI